MNIFNINELLLRFYNKLNTPEYPQANQAPYSHSINDNNFLLDNIENKLEKIANKNQANWYPWLDANSKILASQIPDLFNDYLTYNDLASFPITWEDGKLYTAKDTNKTYRWDWTTYIETSPQAVLSVAWKTWNVALVKADVWLWNVDNTTDALKLISTATQNALDDKLESTDLKTVNWQNLVWTWDIAITNENTITSITFWAINGTDFPNLDLKDWQGFYRINIENSIDAWRFTIWYTSNTLDKKFFINWNEIITWLTITNTQTTIDNAFVPENWLAEIKISIWWKEFKYFIYFEWAWSVRWKLTLQERFYKYNRKSLEIKTDNYTLLPFDNILYFDLSANKTLTLSDYFIYNDAPDTTAPIYKIITNWAFTLTIQTTWNDDIIYNWAESSSIVLNWTNNEYCDIIPLNTWKFLITK